MTRCLQGLDTVLGAMLLDPNAISASVTQGMQQAVQATKPAASQAPAAAATPKSDQASAGPYTPFISDPVAAAAAAGMQSAAQTASSAQASKKDSFDWDAFGKAVSTVANAAASPQVKVPPVYVEPKKESHTGLWVFLGVLGVAVAGTGVYFIARKR